MARCQCGGVGSQWSPEDVDKIKVDKHMCLGLTLDSYAAQETGVTNRKMECASPCLFVSGNPLDAHRWVKVKSLLNREQFSRCFC